MKKDNAVYLQHMLVSMNQIEKYTHLKSLDEFLLDEMLQDAVIRQLEILGEASDKLTREFREQHRELPWFDIKAMRNKLIHEYFDLDHEIIWNTVQLEVPKFKAGLLMLLKKLGLSAYN